MFEEKEDEVIDSEEEELVEKAILYKRIARFPLFCDLSMKWARI